MKPRKVYCIKIPCYLETPGGKPTAAYISFELHPTDEEDAVQMVAYKICKAGEPPPPDSTL